MKRIMTALFAAAMLLLGTNAHAQLSVSAGYTHAKTVFDVYDLINKKANLDGFYGGFTYNIPIASTASGSLGVAPGVYFAYLMKDDANLGVVKGDLSESYLDIPVDFNFSMPVADGMKFIVFAGPTFQIGATSNVKVSDLTTIGSKIGIPESVIDADNDMYDGTFADYLNYKRFDIAVGGGVGMDFEDIIRVTIGYDCGLLNRGGDVIGVHRNQLHIGMAYLF